MFHVFILNEVSLRGQLKKITSAIKSVCENNKLKYRFLLTDNIENLKSELEKIKSMDNTVLYAVGGDGTLQTLVNNVDLSNTILQYLPYGTGNNAYNTFYQQKFDLEQDILSENIIEADLGIANGEYFTGMVGLGIDGKSGNNLAKFKKLGVPGKAKYYSAILYTILTDANPINVKMHFDGNTRIEKSSMISITNGPTIGGKTPINPKANAFDGKLNALIADDLSRLDFLRLMMKVDSGAHLQDPRVSTIEFKKMLITSEEELLYQLDGEIRKTQQIDINVCPKILKMKGKR